MLPIRRTMRLQHYDYSQSGAYFITIASFEHRCTFAQIKQHQITASQLGKIIIENWLNIPSHYADAELDYWVLMPNHFHGILWLKPNNQHSLSHMIGSFKSSVTKQAHEMHFNGKVWQRNYWEHIIRDEQDLLRIREYIRNNPQKWELDKLYQP